MRTTREVHYKGPAEVWVDGAQQFEADVRLTKREVVEDVQMLAGTESVLAGTRWDGRFRGLTEENLRALHVAGEFRAETAGRSYGPSHAAQWQGPCLP